MATWGVPTVTVLVVLAAGCVDPGVLLRTEEGSRDTMREIPRIGSLDLSEAALRLDGHGCTEAHLVLPANASIARERVPVDLHLHQRAGDETRIAVTLIQCEHLVLHPAPAQDEGRTRGEVEHTIQDPALVEISVPIEPPSSASGRQDWLFGVLASDRRLATSLADLGLDAWVAPELSIEADPLDGVATQVIAQAVEPVYPFETTATSVPIDAELPFGAAKSLGRTLWAPAEGGRAKVQIERNVTQVGGLSGTLETRPRSEMARLLGDTDRPAFGFHARYDARWGLTVVPADRSGSGFTGLSSLPPIVPVR